MPQTAPRLHDAAAIEVRLTRFHQLFNSFDPSPFHEKDLDDDAEEYIVGSADEFPLHVPLRLIIHLPVGWPGNVAACASNSGTVASRF